MHDAHSHDGIGSDIRGKCWGALQTGSFQHFRDNAAMVGLTMLAQSVPKWRVRAAESGMSCCAPARPSSASRVSFRVSQSP